VSNNEVVLQAQKATVVNSTQTQIFQICNYFLLLAHVGTSTVIIQTATVAIKTRSLCFFPQNK